MSLSFLIFGAQVFFSFLAFGVIFHKLIIPHLEGKPAHLYFSILLIPHLFRHSGFTALLPQVTDPNIPSMFSYTLAVGDLITLIILYVAIGLIFLKSKAMKPALWLFSLLGIAHLSAVIFFALWLNVTEYQLGFVWIIATFYAPSLWVSHFYILRKLMQTEPNH